MPSPLAEVEDRDPAKALEFRADCDPIVTQAKKCPLLCGNGQVDVDEQCDDGNFIDGDGCNHLCKLEYPDTCGGICEYEGQVCWCGAGGRTCLLSTDDVLFCNGNSSILCVSFRKCDSDADCGGNGSFCYPTDQCGTKGICYSSIGCSSQERDHSCE